MKVHYSVFLLLEKINILLSLVNSFPMDML